METLRIPNFPGRKTIIIVLLVLALSLGIARMRKGVDLEDEEYLKDRIRDETDMQYVSLGKIQPYGRDFRAYSYDPFADGSYVVDAPWIEGYIDRLGRVHVSYRYNPG